MAENWIIEQTVELTRPVQPYVGQPVELMLPGDHLAHTLRIKCKERDMPVNLTGYTAAGYFKRTDGNTVLVVGSITGNVVDVTLSQECYAFAGNLRGVVRITNSTTDAKITLCDRLFHVGQAVDDGGTIDPGEVIPSIDDLLAEIEAMEEATAAAEAAAECIADDYSASATYAVGDYALHNGGLYRCTTAITSAETWTAAHWTQVVFGSEVDDLKSEVEAAENEINKASSTVPTDGASDLDLIDQSGNVLARFSGGGFQTKDFNTASDVRHWAGKKWAAVGDSLTEVNQRTTKHYHDYIAEATGISVVNLGHSGAGYYARPSDYSFQIRVGQVPLDSDVVTIFGSGNDVGKKNLGNVTDTVSADTLCGYINNTFDLLFARFVAVNLGVITPTPWKNGNNDWTPENPGNPMELYVDAIVEICRRRSIPCLDLYHNSNLRPMDSAFRTAAFSKDEGNGIHPDETGHFLIAARFQDFLETLLLH